MDSKPEIPNAAPEGRPAAPAVRPADEPSYAPCVLLVREDVKLLSLGTGRERLFFGLAAAVLLLNFFGWGLYFSGHQSLFVIMTFLVVMPPLYYVFIGLWRQNFILSACGAVFLAVHFLHVYGNLKNTI